MEFSEVIKKRLTTLRYTNRKVSKNNIDVIIESATIAPSAKNRQPWRFYILNDEEKEKIADKMEQWENDTGLVVTIKRTAKLIKDVGNCILIYSKKWNKDNCDKIENPEKLLNGQDISNMVVMHDYYFSRIKADVLSIGAAVENMVLKATELGIDSTWICDVLFIEKDINKYLELEEMELICALAFGYKKEEPKRKGRFKKEYLILNGEK